MHDSDTELFGKDEPDYNSGSVTNASDILVPATNVHSTLFESTSFNSSAHLRKNSATWRWKRTEKPSGKVKCELTANILLHISCDPRPFDVFEKDIDLNKLISHTVAKKHLYASQNGCNFVTNDAEVKAFLGMNSIMSINKLLSIEHCQSNKNTLVTKGLEMFSLNQGSKKYGAKSTALMMMQLSPTIKLTKLDFW